MTTFSRTYADGPTSSIEVVAGRMSTTTAGHPTITVQVDYTFPDAPPARHYYTLIQVSPTGFYVTGIDTSYRVDNVVARRCGTALNADWVRRFYGL